MSENGEVRRISRTRFDLLGGGAAKYTLAPFSGDVVVHDEKRTHRGTGEIRAWIEQATIGTKAIAAPMAIRADDRTHHVTATVSGEFAGSPVGMTFHFRLEGDHIAKLKID